jgi:hypothetical protein
MPSASVVAAPPADAGAPVTSSSANSTANAAALDRSRQWLADLKWTVAHKATANPQKAGEGDAASKCDAVEAARTSVAPDAEPEYRTNLDEASALCAFDVPLVTAAEALDQLRFSPSQASRLLMCKVARREIDRARAVHPRDAKVRHLDSRRGNLCR